MFARTLLRQIHLNSINVRNVEKRVSIFNGHVAYNALIRGNYRATPRNSGFRSFGNSSKIDAKPLDKDYYLRLGLSRTANSSEITKAYRKLAMRYHPDHNAGDPVAAKYFTSINAAYQVLNDPNKKSSYDQNGEDDKWEEYEQASTDVSQASMGARVMMGVLNKFGIPVDTVLPTEMLVDARDVNRNKFNPSKSTQFELGQSVHDAVNVQKWKFYTLKIPPQFQDGFLLQVHGKKSDRFKLVVFDSRGAAAHLEDSIDGKIKGNRVSYARLFVDTDVGMVTKHKINIQKLNSDEGLKELTLDMNLSRSNYMLIAVFGDNFFDASRFDLCAYPCTQDTREAIADISKSNKQLLKLKDEINDFKPGYIQAEKELEEIRVAYQKALEKRSESRQSVKELESRMEEAYAAKEAPIDSFIELSQSKSFKEPIVKSDGGIKSGISGLFSMWGKNRS